MYRSKDKAYMEDLKKSVLEVTRGYDKPERKYALEYLRTHMKVDDLHRYALRKFPNKVIVFGSGSYKPKIVVVTKDPITEEQLAKLTSTWTKMKVKEDDVYYAHLRFVKTKKKQEERADIFQKLIRMLSPNIILCFDGVTVDVESEMQKDFAFGLDVITDKEKADERKILTQAFKDIRPILRQ